MKEEDIGGFYGVYQEIKSQYAQFIQNIKQKPIIHSLKLDKNHQMGSKLNYLVLTQLIC